ncbi:MAG: lipoprotein [Bacteroidota bacterium]
MKRILLALTYLFLLAGCSKEEAEVQTTQTANLAYYDHSNFGTYKGVFASKNTDARATLELNIYESDNSSVKTAYAKAKLNFDDGSSYELTSNQEVLEGVAITNLSLSSAAISFLFSVEANGSNPTITDVVFQGDASHIIIAKETETASVTAITGTYDCGSCNGHPLLSTSTTKTFNFLITESTTSNTRVVATQATLDTIVYTGIGIEDACVLNGNVLDCNLLSGDMTTNVGYFANGNPVTWNGNLASNNLPANIGDICEDLNGVWQWPSNSYGLITGTFTSDINCNF